MFVFIRVKRSEIFSVLTVSDPFVSSFTNTFGGDEILEMYKVQISYNFYNKTRLP